MRSFLTPHRLWIAIFVIWGVLLTGYVTLWESSAPGILQAVRLQSLKREKRDQMAGLERQILRMQNESERLTKNRVAQEREVRRVLGYAGQDEILFDFSSAVRVEQDPDRSIESRLPKKSSPVPAVEAPSKKRRSRST